MAIMLEWSSPDHQREMFSPYLEWKSLMMTGKCLTCLICVGNGTHFDWKHLSNCLLLSAPHSIAAIGETGEWYRVYMRDYTRTFVMCQKNLKTSKSRGQLIELERRTKSCNTMLQEYLPEEPVRNWNTPQCWENEHCLKVLLILEQLMQRKSQLKGKQWLLTGIPILKPVYFIRHWITHSAV